MAGKVLLTLFFLYSLVLLQSTFFVHFDFLGIVPNFVLIAVISINLFEGNSKKLGIFAAFSGGLMLDIFSFGVLFFFGFYTLVSLFSSFFIKCILKKYVQTPTLKEI